MTNPGKGNFTVRRVLVVLVLLLVSGIYAQADPLTAGLKLTGVGGANDGRVYVYPYNFDVTINGVTFHNTALVCDDYYDDISIGESWTATVYNINDILGGAGQMGTTTTPLTGLQSNRQNAYLDAAWLYKQLLVPGSDAIGINHAIWALFTNTTAYFTGDEAPGYWYDKAETWRTTHTLDAETAYLADVVFYTPNPGTQTLNGQPVAGRPQEFIGTKVPEPSSLMMLGLGLLGFAVLVKRRTVAASR